MSLKIAFFGLPLGALLLADDGHELGVAVLSPVATAGRRRLCRRIGAARVLDVSALGARLDAEVEGRFEREPPDLVVSWFWTRRLSARVLRSARLGAIGVHPSLLPRHRGRNPYFWAIDSGDRETGVTVHELGEGYDDGALIASVRVPVGERNAWQLARALDRPSLALLRESVGRLARGELLERAPQDEQLVSFAPEPTDDLLRVDWRWPSERIVRRIRALAPVPGLALEVRGIRLFVTTAREAVGFPMALEPGEAAVLGGSRLLIRTGDSAVELERVILGLSEQSPQLSALSTELEPGRELEGSELARLVEATSAEPISNGLSFVPDS